jgi:hypothetical protein
MQRCVQPDWGYFEWTEQIISINPYKLIQTFFVTCKSYDIKLIKSSALKKKERCIFTKKVMCPSMMVISNEPNK